MEGIEFEEMEELKNTKVGAYSHHEDKQSFMMKILEKAGITNKNTANLILLAITVISFSISFYLYTRLYGEKKMPPPSPSEIRAQMMRLESMPAHR